MDQTTSAPDYKKMYKRVAAMAKIGVWECELATEKLTWADAVYDIFDMPRGSRIERHAVLSCYEINSRRELELVRSEAIKNGTGFQLDINIRTPKGNKKWIRLTADVEQEHGISVRIFGTKQDISEEKLAQDKMDSLQAEVYHLARLNAMNAMASTLAHEINQPLTAVANYMVAANRLMSRGSVETKLSECIDGALESALKAGDIIRRVREMSRHGCSQREHIDLSQLVADAVALVAAANPDVPLNTELNSITRVIGNRLQIQQVLVNLFQNSMDAVGRGPCLIEIGGSQKDDIVTVCVSDNGPGIPVEILSSIFESHVTTKSGELGIGLSICRTIIESHGGHITAANRSLGGASVCFTLPCWHKEGRGSLG